MAPVLKRALFSEPVIIERIELLRRDRKFFVRVTSKDGAVGVSIANRSFFESVYPLFLLRVAPYFKGKDARDLDALIDGVYLHGLNYKWQGLAFWACVATLEFAILDMLGRIADAPGGALLGEPNRTHVDIYYANNDRTSSAEVVAEKLEVLAQTSGASALKYKVGARMGYTDSSTARDLALIPMARRRLGDDITLYVDANGSYDPPTAIRIGKVLEVHQYGFFEEPAQFDHYEETKAVADALRMPIAGGEQETSMRRFQWLIENGAIDLAQPDLTIFGGFIRSIRVARIAAAAGLEITPHIAGGFDTLYALHFASITPNMGAHLEYKGDDESLPYTYSNNGGRLTVANGKLTIPTGPGLGVEIDPDYLKGALQVEH